MTGRRSGARCTGTGAGAFPDGEIEMIGRWLAGPAGRPVVRRGEPTPAGGYTVVPSAAAPRLLVPAGSVRHASAAVRAAAGAATGPARWRQRAVRAGFAVGLGDRLFPHRLCVAGPEPATLADHLSEVLAQPVWLGLRIGPPRANRKPVLCLLDRRARVLGFAKLAVDPLTRGLLAVERTALDTLGVLADNGGLAGVRIPRVRHAGPWHDWQLLVVSAVPSGAGRGLTRGGRQGRIARAAATVARAKSTITAPVAGSPYHATLAGRIGKLPADRHRALLAGVLATACDSATVVEFGGWHGDWFAGNRAVTAEAVSVWDWERYAAGVPVGFDLLHDAFMTGLLARSRPLPVAAGRVAARAAALVAPLGVPAARAPAVAALYFTEIATRYREDDNRALGERLGRPREWVPAALAALGPPWSRAPERE